MYSLKGTVVCLSVTVTRHSQIELVLTLTYMAMHSLYTIFDST